MRNIVEHFKVDESSNYNGSPTDVGFSREDIEAACLQLSANSAAGPDGMPAALLTF